MGIDLKPETVLLIREEIQNGHFRSVDEIIVRGVQARREETAPSPESKGKTRAEAVAHIRELRQGNRLPPGMTIRDHIKKAALE